jgi:predicted MFS family arabinose efflux permease
VLPPLRSHLGRHTPRRVRLLDVLLHPNHLRAYTLTAALMLSSWTIFPFLAIYLVHNVGLPESDLRYVWLCGGVATLLTMTPTGWVADSRDKLGAFRAIGVFCLLPVFLITNLPPASLVLTLAVTTLFMVATSIRWVPLMAMITASAAPRHRGSFMSVNASVQQMFMALAPLVAGLILGEDPDRGSGAPLTGFPLVGLLAAAAMIASVLLAGRLRRAADAEGQPTPEVREEAVAEVAVF